MLDFAGALFLFTSSGCFKETNWLGHDKHSRYRQSFLRNKSASLSPSLSLLKLWCGILAEPGLLLQPLAKKLLKALKLSLPPHSGCESCWESAHLWLLTHIPHGCILIPCSSPLTAPTWWSHLQPKVSYRVAVHPLVSIDLSQPSYVHLMSCS